MRASRHIIRSVGLMLLLLLTVQLTGLTCIGERSSAAADTLVAAEVDHHQQQAGYLQPDGDGLLPGPGQLYGNGDLDGCPCHLGFARPMPVTVITFLHVIAPAGVPDHPSVTRIPAAIFQPPKITA